METAEAGTGAGFEDPLILLSHPSAVTHWRPPSILGDSRTKWRSLSATVQQHWHADRAAASTTTHDRDLVWVTTKLVDVALNPVESFALVKEASVCNT